MENKKLEIPKFINDPKVVEYLKENFFTKNNAIQGRHDDLLSGEIFAQLIFQHIIEKIGDEVFILGYQITRIARHLYEHGILF